MKEANAIGGKTARPCDGCLKKRARWYCVADDAFLCQSCDSSVHSANPLASRHERVRLETASSVKDNVLFPVWCRKARTPRTKAKQVDRSDFHDNNPLVPDLEDGLEIGHHDFHDNLLCQVPTDDDLHGYLLPTDVDLADFAANVESLLGLDDDSGDTKGLDFLECKEENDDVGFFKEAMVKIKDEDHEGVIGNLCLDTDWGFEYSHLHEDVKGLIEVAEGEAEDESNTQSSDKIERNVHLRLNYDDVINAWASQGCPWTNGTRPDEFNLDECWPHCSVCLYLYLYFIFIFIEFLINVDLYCCRVRV